MPYEGLEGPYKALKDPYKVLKGLTRLSSASGPQGPRAKFGASKQGWAGGGTVDK